MSRNIHTKIGTIKDRNGMDLTEAEEIKKRCQEQRKTVPKRILMTHLNETTTLT